MRSPMPTIRRQALLFIGAGVLASLAVLPYALDLNPAVQTTLEAEGIPLAVLVLGSALQSAVLLVIAVSLGLRAMRGAGFAAPVSAALVERRPVWPIVRAFLPRALAVGVLAGLAIIALDQLFAVEGLRLGDGQAPAWWMGLLASFYGGIVEELLLRLFLLSLFAWGLRTLFPRQPAVTFWTANIAAAVLFGLGHLPATAGIVALTPLVIVRALVLNGVAGVAFGWLYRKDGLEAAMVAHATADVVLHVLVPLVLLAAA